MIIILKNNPDPSQLKNLTDWLESQKIAIHPTYGAMQTILGLVGDTTAIDINLLKALEIVEDVKRVQEPYKKANRKFHPEDSVVEVGNTSVGGGNLTLIAGPCSVESEEQICAIAEDVKKSGATMLRGGAFKPRTSPYSFQGLRNRGLELLLVAKEHTGLPIVTEIMDASQLPAFKDVDLIQVGARNMQNFELLKVLGRQEKPVLLKRGFSATYEELLMAAEYIMAGGNENVILCERGIRTFETFTRNTLDLSVIPAMKKLSHLPVIIDPSHASGKSAMVPPLSCAAVAAGADGLIIEVHNDPEYALCDGPQSLRPESFDKLARKLRKIKAVMDEGI